MGWIAERMLAWISCYRKMSKDYVRLPETTGIIIYALMLELMVKMLGKICV
jgi:hypothetical protein